MADSEGILTRTQYRDILSGTTRKAMMTGLRMFDGATPWIDDAKPDDLSRLQAVKNHGGIAVSVYIVGTPGNMRHASKRDVEKAYAEELGIVPNWERANDFFRTATIPECVEAGKEALAACRLLGIPDNGTVGVGFSFDYQVPKSGFLRATQQLKACGEGMGGHYVPLGYGQIDLINYWAHHGLTGPHWLMGSTWRATSEFTSDEVGSEHVAVVQSHDELGNWLDSPIPGTDINTITQPDQLLAWWPDNSPYGDSMTPDQVRTIFREELHKVLIGDDQKPHQVRTIVDQEEKPMLDAVVTAIKEHTTAMTGLIIHGDLDHTHSLDAIAKKMGIQ